MPSDEEIIEELQADLEAKRAANGYDQRREPEKSNHRPIPEAMDPAREASLADRQRQRDAAHRKAAVYDANAMLMRERGRRYAFCSLDNFRVTYRAQETVLGALRSYCLEIPRLAQEGRGVFLFGPCGTGKDHLAMGVAKEFIRQQAKPVSWISGASLFERLRDSFGGDRGASESNVLRPLAQAPLLWISDPVPVKGEISAYQAEVLYRLIDGRYNCRRPLLITANIDVNGADREFGAAIARRLRESSLALHCNWPRYEPPADTWAAGAAAATPTRQEAGKQDASAEPEGKRGDSDRG